MWIKAQDGSLCNISGASRIELHEEADDCFQVLAHFPDGNSCCVCECDKKDTAQQLFKSIESSMAPSNLSMPPSPEKKQKTQTVRTDSPGTQAPSDHDPNEPEPGQGPVGIAAAELHGEGHRPQ